MSVIVKSTENSETKASSLKALSDIVINIKYAKFLPDKERRETWTEVCERHKAMFVEKFPEFVDALNEIYDSFIIPKRILPSMRGLQFAGAPVIKNNARIYNCAFVNMESPIAFGEIMFLLMSGCGVGFSVQKHHISRLPTVGMEKRMSYVHRIPDTTEGWADAVKALMLYYFEDRDYPLFDYELIRLKGAPLSSGGKAPGPEPLRKCLESLDALMRRYVAKACAEAGLINGEDRVPVDSITVHDAVCHISVAVLSGGIRRSALLSLFSLDDETMRKCKHGEWWVENPQRGRANNSAALYHGHVSKEQWKSLWTDIVDSHCGEPGAYWSNNVEMGCNPCCVSGETWILTDAGVVQAKDLDFASRKERVRTMLREGKKDKAREEMESVSRLEKAKVYVGGKTYSMESDGFFKSGEKPLYRVRTERGFEIDLTADHRLRVVNPAARSNGEDGWKEVAHMIAGETLVRLSDQSSLLFVDASGESSSSYIGEAEAAGFGGEENEDRYWPGSIALMPSVSTGYQYGKEAAKMVERGGEPFVVTPGWVSDDVHRTSYHFQVQFVRGFLQYAKTYLGCQEPNEPCFLVVEHASRHNLRQLQDILLRLGIVSTVAQSKAWQHTEGVHSGALFNLIISEDGDGLRETRRVVHKTSTDASTTTTTKKTKVLIKHSKDSLATLARLIPDDGELTLIERLKRIATTRSRKDYVSLFGAEPPSFKKGERFIDRVVEIKLLHNGKPQPCYDVTVENVHEFDANGFRAHNCEIGLHSMQFCVSGNTPLITRKHGIRPIEQLCGTEVEIWNGKQWSTVTPTLTRRQTDLVRVNLNDGSYLDCTPDHRFSTNHRRLDKTGVWTERTAEQMKLCLIEDDVAEQQDGPVLILERANVVVTDTEGEQVDKTVAYTCGFAAGDKCIGSTKNGDALVILNLYGDKRNCVLAGQMNRRNCTSYSGEIFDEWQTPVTQQYLQEMLEESGKELLGVCGKWSVKSLRYLIAGWIDANGSENSRSGGKGGVRLYAVSYGVARSIQILLCKCGIAASVDIVHKPSETETNPCVANNEIVWSIQIVDSRDLPCQRVNVFDGLQCIEKAKHQFVKSVEPLDGLHDVYCFNEPFEHKAVFANILTHQCNLVDINAATIESQKDFEARCKAAAILGTLQASFTDFKYLRPEWKSVTERERLIGVGMTGVACRSVDNLDLAAGAEVVRQTNAEISDAIGINRAARLTTLKPAGTSSTVLQCSSGVHSWHSKYYWRRIQLTKQEALYRYLADNFPLAVEDSVYDKSGDQAVARVPVAAPEGAILRTEESLKSFLERVRRFNVEWVRSGHNSGDNANNVSATITFNESKDAEWLGEWLWENRNVYHGLSVLPEDLGSYTQTPFEEITREEYEEARDYLSKFDITQVKEDEDNTTMSQQVACSGGVCELISSRS